MSETPSQLPGGTSSRAPFGGPDSPVARPRASRAPLVSVLGIFALFALFLALVYYVYLPRTTGAFPDDGIRTAEQRRKALAELRTKEAQLLTGYAWADQKAGVVQLPLDRAKELTLQQYQKAQSR